VELTVEDFSMQNAPNCLQDSLTVSMLNCKVLNFNLFYIHLIRRGYDLLNMVLVSTENKVTNIIHDVR
jgi:hypothetical protein